MVLTEFARTILLLDIVHVAVMPVIINNQLAEMSGMDWARKFWMRLDWLRLGDSWKEAGEAIALVASKRRFAFS